MNDTVRTSLNRVRLPIPPFPQGDATKGSLMIRTGFQRQSLLFNETLLAPSEFLIKLFVRIKQIKHI